LIEQAWQEAEQQFGATLKAKYDEIRIKGLNISEWDGNWLGST